MLSKQLLRSGTSIGANVEEAQGGISKADFSCKISIAYKEARETHYWLRLLHATEYLGRESYDSIMEESVKSVSYYSQSSKKQELFPMKNEQ